MISLTKTTQTLEVILDATITSNQVMCYLNYRLNKGPSFPVYQGSSTSSPTSSVSSVTLLSAAAINESNDIYYFSGYNKDTANATLTVRINDGGTRTELTTQVLSSKETLVYDDKNGWQVI